MVLLGKMNKREGSTKKRILKDHEVGKREKEETRTKKTRKCRGRATRMAEAVREKKEIAKRKADKRSWIRVEMGGSGGE